MHYVVFCFYHKHLRISSFIIINWEMLFSDCTTKRASGVGGVEWTAMESTRQRRQNEDREIIVRRPGASGESCNSSMGRRAQKTNNITCCRRYADVQGGIRREREEDETKAERVECEKGEETADSACRWLIIVVIWRGSLFDDETFSSPSPPLLSVSLTRL